MKGANGKFIRFAAILSTSASLLLIAGFAHAVSGTVSGTFQFWNMNNNYCPTTNTCTGARYTQSSHDINVPVSNALVTVLDQNSITIGQGGTAINGSYTVSWTSSVMPTSLRVVAWSKEKNGRIFMSNTDGSSHGVTTSFFGVVLPNTNFQTKIIGTRDVPDKYFNAYWAAEYEYRAVLSQVGIFVTFYTGVLMRGFADSIPGFITAGGTCLTSCSDGSMMKVQLDSGAALIPQGRVMHETGHIAEYLAHAWARNMNFNWPDATTFSAAGPWGLAGAEWGAAAFEEAFATHFGNIAFWLDSSVAPTTCIAAGTCYDNAGNPSPNTNIEASSFPFGTNNCSTAAGNPEGRWPLSYMRYFWDIFDNHNDADGDTYSANQAGDFSRHLGVLGLYANGTAANAIDEPSVNRDGRGGAAYRFNYNNSYSVDTTVLRTDNCSPP